MIIHRSVNIAVSYIKVLQPFVFSTFINVGSVYKVFSLIKTLSFDLHVVVFHYAG